MSSTEGNEDINIDEEEENDYDEEEATGDPSSSRRDAFLQSRRRTVLLQVLFGHMINNRTRQEHNQTRSIQPPNGPLRVLSHEDAETCGATCRFCFEGSHGQEGLVSPCNCSGSSEWVHLACINRWQRQAGHRSEAARVCNVCMSPYQVAPPVPPRLRSNVLKRGTLIVYSDTNDVTSIFHQTVVLLLESPTRDSSTGPFGLIVNSPLLLEQQQEVNLDRDNMIWRSGGPVCSGRLGVTKYILAHTVPQSNEQHLPNNYSSIPVFEEEGDGLQVLVSTSLDGQHFTPALLDRQELSNMMDQLNAPLQQFVVFLGYCKWHCGQLEQEVEKGSWLVCDNGTPQDVLESNDLWQDLNSNNSRLLSSEQLFEDQNSGSNFEDQNSGSDGTG